MIRSSILEEQARSYHSKAKIVPNDNGDEAWRESKLYSSLLNYSAKCIALGEIDENFDLYMTLGLYGFIAVASTGVYYFFQYYAFNMTCTVI